MTTEGKYTPGRALAALARDLLLALTLTGVLPGLAVWGACALGWPVA